MVGFLYLPFWNCHKFQLLNPPEASESVSPLVNKTLEGGVNDSVTHGRSFLVAFPRLSGEPALLLHYLVHQLVINNCSISCASVTDMFILPFKYDSVSFSLRNGGVALSHFHIPNPTAFICTSNTRRSSQITVIDRCTVRGSS